jgi:zinc protease
VVFDEILAAPDVGRLYQRMVYKERLATTTAADAQVEELGGLIRATVELLPGADPRAAESIFFETLDDLLQAGPTEVELQTSKARLRARFARQLEQLGFQGSRAELLGEGILFSGNAAAYQQRLDRMADASREQVIRTARTWVSKHGYFLNTVARGQTERSATIDRAQPVALPDPVPPAFPAVETRRLRSGITLRRQQARRRPHPRPPTATRFT